MGSRQDLWYKEPDLRDVYFLIFKSGNCLVCEFGSETHTSRNVSIRPDGICWLFGDFESKFFGLLVNPVIAFGELV